MEERERFVEKEGWVTWFKVLLILILIYEIISAVTTVILTFQLIQSKNTDFLIWVGMILSYPLLIGGIVGVVMTLKMKKWGFYTLIATQLVNILPAFGVLFASWNFMSFIGALIAAGFFPALLLICVYSGVASTTGKNPFVVKY